MYPYIRIYMYIYTCIDPHTYSCTGVCGYVCMCVRACACVGVGEGVGVYVSACMY